MQNVEQKNVFKPAKTTERAVRGSKFCHVQSLEIRTKYSHITTFVHVIIFVRS
jgi:hypothetical protein